MLFQIKICGITRDEDLRSVATAGADAVGFNLVTKSPRYVAPSLAAELARSAESLGLDTVVVVMNPELRELERICEDIAPGWIQLHGNEGPEIISACGDRPIIKAVSWSGRDEERRLADAWRSCGSPQFAAFLVDAYAPDIGGGSGRTADWNSLKPRPQQLLGIPLLLAGGLRPQNVAEAIRLTACDGVDTASGVESAPGIKDSEITRQFVSAAKTGFQSIAE